MTGSFWIEPPIGLSKLRAGPFTTIGAITPTILKNAKNAWPGRKRNGSSKTNGSGKAALLRTLIGARSAIEGELEWNGSLDIGYYDQQLQDLNPEQTVLNEIRELDSTATDGELRSYLAQFLFTGEDVSKLVGK